MEIVKQYLDQLTPANNVYGMMLTNNKKKYPKPHTHTYCEFTLMISGSIRQKCNNSIFDLMPKQLCFVRETDIHTSISLNCQEAKYYNIGIPTKQLENVAKYYHFSIENLFKPKMPIVINLRQSVFEQLLIKIDLFEKTEFGQIHGNRFLNLLNELFFLIISPSNPHIHIAYSEKTPDFLMDILVKMDKCENFIVGLPKLWEITNLSREYVTRCFKKYLKVTPTEYINALRLNYAKKLLVEENCPISEVIYKCGFNTESYFYSQFKKLFACTPKEMIKKTNDIYNV